MSYIQLPYGVVDKEKQMKLDLPRNYGAAQYFKQLPYLSDTNNPTFQNLVINTLYNGVDLQKYALASGPYGKNIQENINTVVADATFNDAVVRHLLDYRYKGVFESSTLLSVTFKDVKKIDIQNPVVGNILSQVKASQIGEKEVKKLLGEAEDEKIRRRLEALRRPGASRGSSGDGPGPSPPPPPILPSPGGLSSPPAFLPELFPSLDDLFDRENNELQALQPQAVAVPVAASQWRLETDHNRPNI